MKKILKLKEHSYESLHLLFFYGHYHGLNSKPTNPTNEVRTRNYQIQGFHLCDLEFL